MDALQKLLKLCAEKKSAGNYGFLTLLTMGGQQLFSLVVFQCPCNEHNLMYGFVFIFAPAVVLTVAGFFLSSRTWTLVTGCCLNPVTMCPKGNRCQSLYVLVKLTLQALIVPVMWISIALLHGSFYACAMSSWQNPDYIHYLCRYKSELCHTQLFKVTCNRTAMPGNETQEIVLLLQTQSQVIGWCLIAILALLALLCTCWSSCRSNVSSVQISLWKMYINKEKQKCDELAQEYATKLAERNLRSVFENSDPDNFKLPTSKNWEKVSALYTFNPDQYCSTLQRVVEHGDSNNVKDFIIHFLDGQM